MGSQWDRGQPFRDKQGQLGPGSHLGLEDTVPTFLGSGGGQGEPGWPRFLRPKYVPQPCVPVWSWSSLVPPGAFLFSSV